MKSILLKLDDKLFEETDNQVKAKKTSRASYIKTAIDYYNNRQKRIAVEDQLIKEVKLLKSSDPDVALKNEFEGASLADFQKHLNAQSLSKTT